MPYIGKKPADIIATAVDTTTGTFSGDIDVDGTTNLDVVDIDGAVNFAVDVTFADGADIITATAGTSNFRAGVNAGNSIESGGNYNTVVGDEAGTAITTGDNNTAVGYQAGYSNTTSLSLSLFGYRAGYSIIAGGSNNSFFGSEAGYSNTTAYNNVAIGRQSLYTNIDGISNVAVGQASLYANTGASNVAVGDSALASNTTASNNTAVGLSALQANTTASGNSAVGYQAGYSTTTGTNNASLGYQAGLLVTTGSQNVYIGDRSGSESGGITGSNNICIGAYSGSKVTSGTNNAFFGQQSGREVTTGGKNTIIGSYNGNAGGIDIRTASNNIVLSDGDGNPRIVVNSSGRIKLGGTDQDGHVHVFGDFGSGYSAVFHNDGNNSNRYGILSKSGADDASGTNYAFDIADGDGTVQGSITFSGGTVTYGAFTAFHPCIIPNADNDADSTANAYPYGTLLEITNIGYTQKDGVNTERGILYNVQKSSSAKSKSVLGAYGSSMNNQERGNTNLHQALVLGDGHILCNNENGNIAIGDYICTSSTSGEGMKATSICTTIGIAREAVTFTDSTGVLVAVEYGYRQFVPEDLEARITALENG